MDKAIAYLRVSTKDQSDRGFSLPTQEQDIRAYADRMGIEITHVFSEDESGQILDRPEFTKVRDLLRRKEATILIAHDSDRISRTPEHYAILRSEWEKLGIRLHYALRGEIKLGEFGPDVIEDIQGRFARQWLRKLVEATSRGKRGKVAQGNVIVAKRPPYGYDAKEGQLIINPQQSEIVELVFQLYTQENYTIRGITEYLTQKQIPTPADKNHNMYKLRGDGVWTKTFVRNILGRETYIGIWHWGKTKRETTFIDGKKHTKIWEAPRENWIAVEVPVIIDNEVFEAAQQRLGYNKRMASRNTKREYLMAKRVTCSCGRPCYAEAKQAGGKEYLYYWCASRHKNNAGPECNLPYFRADYIDDGAWQYVKNLLANPDHMIELVEARLAQQDNTTPIEDKLTSKQEQLTGKQIALERLTRKYMYGGEDEATFDKIRQETLTEIEQLRQDIAGMEALLDSKSSQDHLLDLARTLSQYEALLLRDDEPFAVKLAWIEAFDLKAVLWMDGKEKMVTYRWYPEEISLSIGTPPPTRYGHIMQIEKTIAMKGMK